MNSSVFQYHFYQSQSAPHSNLVEAVQKRARDVYQRPISDRQRQIFDSASHFFLKPDTPVILDSGCGSGYSTAMLAKSYQNHFVLGIDRSSDRLSHFCHWQKELKVHNCAIVQANLEDFWRLLDASGFSVERHFLLYPNPYPKRGDLAKRWHGHPVFSTLLKISHQLELRSNWEVYAQEFAMAVSAISACKPKVLPFLPKEAISAFERKYVTTNTPLYRLLMNAYEYKLLISAA